jgi:hypothetical protein
MSKGIVIFGVNNERVDYVQLAIMAATFVKKNMPGTDVCLISDENSVVVSGGIDELLKTFSHVQIIPENTVEQFENKRAYKDTQYYHVVDRFRNETRSLVYNLSPFDETLLIDSDFLIMNNNLSKIWGSVEDVMINNQALGLNHNELHGQEFRLNPFGIKMYWATLIYFRKGEKAQTLFNLVDHIKDNWDFYKLTYDFPNHLFRNDYAFSIAIHILNGFLENSNYVVSLPEPIILSALDTDQFFDIQSPTEICLFVNDMKEAWKYSAIKTKGLNVHCMNKLSLINHMDKIMGTLNE